jgi:hypothetical protein
MSGAPHRRKEWDGPIQFAPRRVRDQLPTSIDDIERLDASVVRPAPPPRPPVDPAQIVELEKNLFDALHSAGQHRFAAGASTDSRLSGWLRKAVALAIGGAALVAVFWTARPAIEGIVSLVVGGDRPATAVADTKPTLTPPPPQLAYAAPQPVEVSVTAPVPTAPLSQGTVQPTWTAPPPVSISTTSDQTATVQPAKETRRIASDDLAALIRRGEENLKAGDTSAARLLLERAADAGSARAAFLIGTSYDAAAPGRRAPDAETARIWYRRAADLGSSDALQKLATSAAATPR